MNNPQSLEATNNHATLSLTFAKNSLAHQEHPEHNEDFALVDPEHGLAVICDGVGSVIGAGQGARIAARTIKKRWQQILAQQTPTSHSTEEIETARLKDITYQLLEEANQAVMKLRKSLARKQTGSNVSHQFAYTTIVMALLYPIPTGYLVTYGHVGDSRAYLWHQQTTTLQRLTIDDGYFLYIMERNELTEQEAARIDQASAAHQLTARELEHFGKRNGITQSLGEEPIAIHIGQVEFGPGDRLLLCTDGIHDNLTDAEISELLSQGARTMVARSLVQQARARSQEDSTVQIRAKKDDMSAVVVTCHLLSPLDHASAGIKHKG